MPHLAVTRKGWENERLAAFLLSQIAFVAHPLAIADDIGSDFLCTLFQPVPRKGAEQLFPLSSFVIQIKSNRRAINATKKIDYLKRLEVPFFLGVIDRSKSSLRLYSGEYLPMMFSKHGIPERLTLRPIDNADMEFCEACSCTNEKNCEVKLPSVVAIASSDDADTTSQRVQCLQQLCSRMHANIATWKLDEYVFRLRQKDKPLIMAGPSSIKTFRSNFYWRLAEVFFNMRWILEARPNEFILAEFKIYERVYLDLLRSRKDLPGPVTNIYKELNEMINKKHPA